MSPIILIIKFNIMKKAILFLLLFSSLSVFAQNPNYTKSSYTIVTDSCEISNVPIIWSFTDSLIVAKAILNDSTSTFCVYDVIIAYTSEDDEYMTVLSYRTLFDRLSILFSKTENKIIAIDTDLMEPGKFYPVKK